MGIYTNKGAAVKVDMFTAFLMTHVRRTDPVDAAIVNKIVCSTHEHMNVIRKASYHFANSWNVREKNKDKMAFQITVWHMTFVISTQK
jgi:hypothetical protein